MLWLGAYVPVLGHMDLASLGIMRTGISKIVRVNPAGTTTGSSVPVDGQRFGPPVGAAVWHGHFAHNVYRYAPEGDALGTLVRELFYLRSDGSFDTAHAVNRLACHLTPACIGLIVALVFRKSQERTGENFQVALERTLRDKFERDCHYLERERLSLEETLQKLATRLSFLNTRLRTKGLDDAERARVLAERATRKRRENKIRARCDSLKEHLGYTGFLLHRATRV